MFLQEGNHRHPLSANDLLSQTETAARAPAAMAGSDAGSNMQEPLPHLGHVMYPPDFIEQFEHAIHHVISEHTSGTLLLISISNLAMIINAYGHDTSEIVIHDLTVMIDDILAPGDIIQRLQRDQLGIILTNSWPEDAAVMAGRILNIIQNFGRDNFATTSLHLIGVIGSVSFPLESASVNDALDKAYIAVNSVQAAPHRTFDTIRHEADHARQQMGLANYLFRAFKERRLRLAYQPVIESRTGGISHYEALLRLINPAGKISSAGALIPVAEKMGMIDMIDTMVMEMVIDELRQSPDIVLAFNVSNHTTENAIWLDNISQRLLETPEVAQRLIVEITETAVHRDLRRTAFFVASLQAMGCQVALDDFGSGYTSFRQLKALSVDMVKIDGVFVKDLAHNSDNQFFVRTLLDFAQGFGLQTVAEFVETGDVAKILMEMGVDFMQGYYFGKPENTRSWRKDGEYRSD